MDDESLSTTAKRLKLQKGGATKKVRACKDSKVPMKLCAEQRLP